MSPSRAGTGPGTGLRYAAALLFVVAAIPVTLLVRLVATDVRFPAFFIAIALGALVGGRGPGLLATILSSLAIAYFIIPPLTSFAMPPQQVAALGTFAISGVVVAILVGGRKRLEAELLRANLAREEAARNAATLIERVTDAFYALDGDWRFTYLNGQAERYYERPREAMLGHVLWDVSPERLGTDFEAQLRQAVRSGRAVHFQSRSPRTARWLSVHAYPSADGLSVYFHDVTEQTHAEQERALLAAIVESSDDAIIGTEIDGTIRSWNAGAERIFAYPADEVVGQPFALLVPPGRRDELQPVLDRLGRGERIEQFVTEGVRKDGRRIEVSVTVSPIRDGAGRIVGASRIARDMTERRAAERERERLLEAAQSARAEAEAANRAKDDFLANLSHELRSPLQGILGWVALLKRNQLDAEHGRRALESIDRSVRLQADLVSQLVDITRIASGKLELEAGPLDLAVLVHDTVEEFLPAAQAKGLTLIADTAPCGLVIGDPARLHQVFVNLLSNALKFTPAGGSILVTCSKEGSAIVVRVRDSGDGIAPDFLPHLFARFTQADGSSTRRHGGLGLGLAIVRELMELHRGTVHAESEGPGRGATFVVTLPLALLGVRDVDATSAAVDSRPALTGVGVLLVDDDVDTLEAISALLARAGARVTVAASAREALSALHGGRFDVLVSDLSMPTEDGFFLLRKVRGAETERLRRLPAIALTGFARAEDRIRVLAAGFQAHMPKPVDPDELVKTVATIVLGREHGDAADAG